MYEGKADVPGLNSPTDSAEARWRRRVWVFLVAVVLFLGMIAGGGIVWSIMSLNQRYPLSPLLTFAAIGVMMAVPVVIFWALQKLLQRLWAGGFLAQGLELIRATWDLLAASARALRTRLPGRSAALALAEDEGVASALQRVAALRDTAMGLFATFLAGSAAAAIIALLIQVASFMVNYAQVEKLTDQNRLLWVETQITALNQQFEAQRALAQAEYEQISRILLNLNSTPTEQAFALRRLPDAMRLPVIRAAADPASLQALKEGQPIPIYRDYPNVLPLRSLLLEYMRFDRVGLTLKNRIPEQRTQRSDVEALKIWEPASTELFWTLHRLGPPRRSTNDSSSLPCLWDFVPAGTNQAPELATNWDETLIAKPRGYDAADVKVPTWHLEHLESTQWEAFQAPAAFSGVLSCRLIFVTNAIMRRVHLQGADLSDSDMIGADFSDSHLERVSLTRANLTGADLHSLDLHGVNLISARLTRADLSFSDLTGSSLDGATLTAASLYSANLAGADLSSANLAIANLKSAHLAGADLRSTDLANARLISANLMVANLDSANLVGAELSWAKLAATQFKGATLQGAALITEHVKLDANLAAMELASLLSEDAVIVSSLAGTFVSITWVGDRDDGFPQILREHDAIQGVQLRLPPASLLGAHGLLKPATNLFLSIDGPELYQLVSRSDLPEEFHERANHFRDLKLAELAEIPWPADEDTKSRFGALFGTNRVEVLLRRPLYSVRALGLRQIISFGHGTNAAMITAEQKAQLLGILPEFPDEREKPDVDRLRSELMALEPATPEAFYTWETDWDFDEAAWAAWEAAGKAPTNSTAKRP